jgi:hypothetical protein
MNVYSNSLTEVSLAASEAPGGVPRMFPNTAVENEV